MKKIFILIIALAAITGVFAQTEVTGDQSGVWSADYAPYYVVGEILVPPGQTLTIEAGVTVNFQGYYKFKVQGNLQVLGTETDSVFFTTDNQATGWGGIRFDAANGISNLLFCRIEYGKTSGDYPDIHGGAVALLTSDATFSNCLFTNNDATGDNNGMGGAVYAINTGSSSGPLTVFTDCKFVNNHAFGEGGAIKFTGDMNTELINCEFIENTCYYGGGAISFYSVVDTKMIFCLFANNTTSYSGGGAIHTLGFDNTLIFKNCTLSGNSAPGGDGGAVILNYATADFTNTIVYNNPGAYSNGIYLGFGGYAEINYCDLSMPDGATGSNNIDENPQFIDAGNLDFHLTATSPCIDEGIDIGYEYLGEAPDMGCFEYDPSVIINSYMANDLMVYPNPNFGSFTIQIPEYLLKFDCKIKIYDLNGNPVYSKTVNPNEKTVKLNNIPSGSYLLEIFSNSEKISKKILIQ